MARYVYRQNNSGGTWQGPRTITVMADSDDQADVKAEEKGAYFDGCFEGLDCPCCGDRWSRAYGPEED